MEISVGAPAQIFSPEVVEFAVSVLRSFVPFGMFIVLLYMTRKRDEEYWFAWPLVAFLAGLVSYLGLGSIVVGLLYTHVRE